MITVKPSFWQRFRKAIAALVGAATPAAVVGVLALVGVHIDAGVVAVILSAGAAVLAPGFTAAVAPNVPKLDLPDSITHYRD